jgi:hypothetical protein
LMPWVVVVSSAVPCLSPGCWPEGVNGIHDGAGEMGPGSGAPPAAPTGCLPPFCGGG